jgi:hypothetical protein
MKAATLAEMESSLRLAPQWRHLIGLGLELKGLGEDQTEDKTRGVRFALRGKVGES